MEKSFVKCIPGHNVQKSFQLQHRIPLPDVRERSSSCCPSQVVFFYNNADDRWHTMLSAFYETQTHIYATSPALTNWKNQHCALSEKYFHTCILDCYWPFVQENNRSLVNSLHKGQWRGALIFSLICAWINAWVNNCEAGDLRRHRTHYDVIVMFVAYWNWINSGRLDLRSTAFNSGHHCGLFY